MSVRDQLVEESALWDQSGDLTPFVGAIGGMWFQVEEFAEDTDTVIGWQPLWDVDIAPSRGLPWLCVVTGERPPAGATDDQLRALIRAAPNQDRGQPRAIADAIKQTLTGSKLVGMRERTRDDGTPDDDALTILVLASEVPDQNAVLAAIRRTVPADIHVYLTNQAVNTWTAIESAYGPTWSDVETHGPSWATIQTGVVGYVLY